MVRSLIVASLTALFALGCGRPVPSEASETPPPASGCAPWRGDAVDARAQGSQLIQRQHSGEVWSLLGLGDGLIATGGDDNTVRVWDLETRTLLRVIRERQLIGAAQAGQAVVVEGYEGPGADWTEVAVVDGRVRPAYDTPPPTSSNRDAGAASPPGAPRPIARVAGTGPARWVGVDSARRQLVWFDDGRKIRGRLEAPVAPNSHDLQLVDRITVRANFWSQGETLVGELDPDGYGPRPAVLVGWRLVGADSGTPWRVLSLQRQADHLLGLDRSGRHALLHASAQDGKSELRSLDLQACSSPTEPPAGCTATTRLLELKSPSHRTRLAVAPAGDLVAIVDGPELTLYDRSRPAVRWTARAMDRVLGAAAASPGAWQQKADSEPHLFEEVAFTGDGRFVAVRTRVGVFAYDAAGGRYRGDLGARPRPITAAPRFASADQIIVNAGGHLQRWSLTEATLESTEQLPPYFDRSECHNGNLVRWCSLGYADAYAPLAQQDVLRVRSVGMQYGPVPPGDPAVALTSCERPAPDADGGEAATARGIPIVFEHMAGGEPLPPLRDPELPELRAWPPPPATRTMLCSPVRLDYFHVDQQLDAARGRIVGAQVGGSGGAIYDLRSGITTALEGKTEPERWVAEGRLVAGTLRPDIGQHFAALWTDQGRLLWRAADGKQRLVAVRSDGAQAAYTRWSRDAQPTELFIVDLADGRELSRITMPERCNEQTRGRTSVWPAETGELTCGTSSGALLRIRDGQIQRVVQGDGDAIRALSPSPDGQRLVTWSLDGVLRIWSSASLEQLASLVAFDDGEWLAFTPAGFYGGTPEAAERVAWSFQGGPSTTTTAEASRPEVFRFEQFAARFRRPELVRQRLAGQQPARPRLSRPPAARLLEPPIVESGNATVRLQFESPSRVDWVRLYVEGRELARQAVCAPRGVAELEVPLVHGTNRLTAIAFDAEGLTSNPAQADVSSRTGRRPELYLISVGVSRYPHLAAELQLEAADDDARSLVAAFEKQSGPGKTYRKLHATRLLDGEASVEAIDRAVAELSRMQPQDVAIVFLAGHGVKPADDEEMVFLTSATRSTKAADVRRAGFGWQRLGERLAAAKGRVLVLLDACHSGHLTRQLVVPNEAMAHSLAADGRAGAVVFAASKGRQLSFEASGPRALTLVEDDPALAQLQRQTEPHGLFTAALLTSLDSSEADRNGDGAVHLSELLDAITGRVIRASGGRQTPWVARRELFGDFCISQPTAR